MASENDQFAQIAMNGIGGRTWLLEEPKPRAYEPKKCFLTDRLMGEYSVPKRAQNAEQLRQELADLRQKMKLFLADYAPALAPVTQRTEIRKFVLDGKETVTVPHYEGPIGYGKKTYESEFLCHKKEDKAYYICFKGADYIAVVYVNGICVGTHEGFFSPFEFEITHAVADGENQLRIDLYNDHIFNGNSCVGKPRTEGDKLYAATGLGWDDPAEGWHHCPAGMGIYGKVFIEERSVHHLTDLYVRPMPEENKAEMWIEVNSANYEEKNIKLHYSIYGQNFQEVVAEDVVYEPYTTRLWGFGDCVTDEQMAEQANQRIPLLMKHGKNIFKVPVSIPQPKVWTLDEPWLYQLQVTLEVDGVIMDTAKCQFGMRSFTQDTTSEKKGMFYLNGNKIRLRGANTMGFEQQDVLREDYDQLIDDILLAKLCNMNFLRLTQRPVQDEIYEYCDKLGLMTQSDLPLFGSMRRTKIAEAVKQTEEMIRMVRKHPCNVMISYINEPSPNARNQPHRHLLRDEMEQFFAMCDTAARLLNPDQVIKHVDGDYDPPTESMPDNHCYPMWYNGHGVDIGKLHRGYWIPVLSNWYYGCGEYGAEGLDPVEIMQEMYPKEWLQEPFDPKRIVNAQTGRYYGMFFDKPDSIEQWVEVSQNHQAFATKLMTEAFRRDDNMVSFAIHLFIDAWPSGWMKTIMDCRRNPKKAFFAYRDALQPKMLSLRTDRFTYTAGEDISIECFLCNDTNEENDNYRIVYELYRNGQKVKEGSVPAQLKACTAGYSSECCFKIDAVDDREKVTIRAILLDEKGNAITDNAVGVEIFEDVELPEVDKNTVLITNLKWGEYEIAGETVKATCLPMRPIHFASCQTGHPAVAEFEPMDFRYWYNEKEDMITPICGATFEAEGFTPILNGWNAVGGWKMLPVCAEKYHEGKHYIISTLDIRTENPVAKRLLRNLLQKQ